jgi:hypothetical protein
MQQSSVADHRTILDLLPDYALGRLDDASAGQVARHLGRCPGCRREFDHALDALGALAATPPPASARAAILWRATHAPATAGPSAEPPFAAGDPQARTPFGKPLPRLAVIAASLAILLIGSLSVWNYELRSGIDQQDQIYALVSNPAAAHPLQETQLALPGAVAGVVFAEPQGHDAYLVANGLPPLPADKRYQIWLYTVDTPSNKPISGGLLTVGADGDARMLFETPKPFGDYIGVALTAEPQAGSPAPTSEMALGGSINPGS